MNEKRNSFKNTLLAIIAFLVCFVPVSMFLTINTPSGNFKAKACEIEYKILYSSDIDHGEPISESLWAVAIKPNGNYPVSYISGTETIIDDLKKQFYDKGGTLWGFNGWYLDDARTIPFNGTITSDMTGDLIIFADINLLEFPIVPIG